MYGSVGVCGGGRWDKRQGCDREAAGAGARALDSTRAMTVFVGSVGHRNN